MLVATLAVCTGAPSHGAAGGSRPLPVFELADGVYAVPGDSGRGSEGRPNAGFVVGTDGVLAIDALASPAQGAQLLAAIRAVTPLPIRQLLITHHHPDHHFGAVVFRREGARVLAHPDRATAVGEAGDSALAETWTAVVGAGEMRGFEFANRPDVPIRSDTVLQLGGRAVHVLHLGPAHTPGDLVIWLPAEGVLFAGDLLIEDGVTMVVDGDSEVLLGALDVMQGLGARVVVPG
ncbi:MAG: MBL fold metallo-hydrolase, partial [Gemmatimonadetes bacterium]|nr:MBL fold metallo-hydrolase [Gemmatimonadota bacterium]